MKKLICICAAFLVLQSAVAEERPSPEQLENWMTYYYLHPEPAEVADALKAVTALGYFENDDVQAPLSGFFAEVFRANPEKVDAWVTPYIGIPRRHILYSALWMANSGQSKAALERMAKALEPEEAAKLRSLIASVPPTVETIAVDTEAALDYLWGCFMASGSDAPVLRIIDQMKLANTKGDAAAKLIGGAAGWSVAANARQHERVLKIVEARVRTADPETKALLEKLLSGIQAEKTKNDR